MTRRISLAILATVWTTLVVVGISAYIAVRAVLLADLDASLVARAASLPQIVDEEGHRFAPVVNVREDDRYIIRSASGRTMGRPTTAAANTAPQLVRAVFAKLPDGTRVRNVTLRAIARPLEGGEPRGVSVVFSGSSEHFDTLLNRLAIALVITGAVGGALAAMIARSVARRALRPLEATAKMVGSIDEQTLDQRIDAAPLPPELLPFVSKLNQMLGRLEESTRQRQQFLADASHELRTPVAALLTALEVALRRDRDANSYRQILQTCLADARLLQHLVEALLAYVRSGSMARQYPVEQFHLDTFVGECVAALAPLADARSIHVEVACHQDLILKTQPDRLRSMLLNLLGNALEYINRDVGQIGIQCVSDGDAITLVVRDNGPGIAPEHLARLFEPFYRVDSARASGHLGLGLFLVQMHAHALGGTCHVTSTLGVGTVFRVRIPGAIHPEVKLVSPITEFASK